MLFVRPIAIFADIIDPPERARARRDELDPLAEPLARRASEPGRSSRTTSPGRIANRVMQTGDSLRESAMSSIRAVWYIGVYGVTAFALMTSADWRLGVPTFLWVDRLRGRPAPTSCRACASSRARARKRRSHVMGRVVDSYTNILTVKLFARLADEDAYVRDAIDEHQDAMAAHMRDHHAVPDLAHVAECRAARRHRCDRHHALGARRNQRAAIVATALPLAWQIGERGGLGELGGHRRSSRTSAWCRKACSRSRCRTRGVDQRRREAARGRARRDPLRRRHVRLRPQRRGAGARRAQSRDPSRRARRARRPLGRGQVDARQPAAALPRARAGSDPDRRPGHRARDAGEPARGDRHGDARYVAAASLDRGEHPLRTAERERQRRGRGCAQSASAGVHPRAARLERPHRLRRTRGRARREALGRPAAAHRARARDSQRRADPRARRGDVGARQRSRARDSGAAHRR